MWLLGYVLGLLFEPKNEDRHSSETSVNFCRLAPPYVPEGGTLYCNRGRNIRSEIMLCIFQVPGFNIVRDNNHSA
jgi:hypothetical protein